MNAGIWKCTQIFTECGKTEQQNKCDLEMTSYTSEFLMSVCVNRMRYKQKKKKEKLK